MMGKAAVLMICMISAGGIDELLASDPMLMMRDLTLLKVLLT